MLLRKLATRIIEIDRGELVDWSCDYDTFLMRKQAVLDIQEKEWDRFDKKMAQEEIWIRQGIKARRTRNEGRVRSLVKMREEKEKRRIREGTASIKISDAQRSGKLVIDATEICFSYDKNPLIKNFTTRIARGDKIGIIGPNGSGKTTLVRLLLGDHSPLSGTIKRGSNLAISYFDQLREQLDEEKNVWENVLPHGNVVTINGRDKHIISYLQDFLFTPERAKTPVKNLSGGERNRLLLARLFTQPANFFVFDEPTNDLDAETLELLEELLANLKETVLLICHDRSFLNNVVTSTFVFCGNGVIKEYIGGYDDWLEQKQDQDLPMKVTSKPDKKKLYKEQKKEKQKKKRSYHEAREILTLPSLIESLEQEQELIHTKMANPDFFRNKDDVVSAKQRLAELEIELNNTYERWEYLESIES